MASSFFRGSCAIFWLTWLMSLAYVFGVTVYETSYIFKTNAYIEVTFIVKLICYMILAMSFVGCVFVKCDISHISCFLLYTVPLFFIVPGLCIYGIILTRGNFKINSENIRDAVQDYWKDNGELPNWLEQTEIDSKCCGVYSWKDYYLNILKKSSRTVPKSILPVSCCTTFKYESHKELCLNATISADLLVPESESSQSTYETTRDETNYKDSLINPDIKFPYLNEKYRNLVSINGCSEAVNASLEATKAAHFSFLIIMIIFSFLMAVVYIKSWCSSRKFAGGRSDHSLDIETNSLLDIPHIEPMVSLAPKDSNLSQATQAFEKGDTGSEKQTNESIRGSIVVTVPTKTPSHRPSANRPSVTQNPNNVNIDPSRQKNAPSVSNAVRNPSKRGKGPS